MKFWNCFEVFKCFRQQVKQWCTRRVVKTTENDTKFIHFIALGIVSNVVCFVHEFQFFSTSLSYFKCDKVNSKEEVKMKNQFFSEFHSIS